MAPKHNDQFLGNNQTSEMVIHVLLTNTLNDKIQHWVGGLLSLESNQKHNRRLRYLQRELQSDRKTSGPSR